MNQEYFDKWTEITKKAQEPLQALTELNVKTLQSFSYIKPEELAELKKPEAILEKQISITVENAHKALNYMQESFKIYENAMLSLLKDIKEKTDVKH